MWISPSLEEVTLVGKAVEYRPAHRHDPLMGTPRLVRREQIDVGAEGSDIGQTVRRSGNPIDDRDHIRGGELRADVGDRVQIANDVRAMRERCQLGAIGNETIERSDIEHPGVGILSLIHI